MKYAAKMAVNYAAADKALKISLIDNDYQNNVVNIVVTIPIFKPLSFPAFFRLLSALVSPRE